MSRPLVFLVRIICGAIGGLLLWRLFFPRHSFWIAVILAFLVVVSAYLSEAVRRRHTDNDPKA